jgi:transglutaminase-like putative cysteine protease
MSQVQLIPRISLIWLLVAQVLVIVPHLAHLPLWIVGLWLGCAAWRVQIFRMRARYPSGWVKLLLMLGCALGVFLSRGSLIGLDAAVVLLVAAFILKLVEMRSRRDALVLIFLGFFTVVTAYLFDDSLLAAAYSLLPVLCLLAALIGLQQSNFVEKPLDTLRLAGNMLLQSLPLMLLLFVFFPRMEPLWRMPLPQERNLTGLSDSMAPADIAELSRSTALAFRASFADGIPPRVDLYWRALTFERFDGRRWSQADAAALEAPPVWQKRGEEVQYSILAQPSGQTWLFALDVAQSRQGQIRQLGDFRLKHYTPLQQSLLYQVSSWPDSLRQLQLPAAERRRNLQLPAAGDPRSRTWAQSLRKDHESDEQLVRAVLQHFNREAFYYTLKPPAQGSDTIDAFLFDTRRGFCAHYAGAMTFVLRAAGVPSRVVAGYQGGELNSAGGYVSVRQFDAHAWVEYWLPERGWISVDPTFEVAPERIEQGLEEALAEEGSFLEDSPLSPLRYRNLAVLNQLRQAWENLNYSWQRWVLGYQGAEQLGLLQRWFGSADWRSAGIFVVAGVVALGLVMALLLLKPWQGRADAQQRVFLRFERALARHGLQRAPGEGARDFVARAARHLPAQAEQLQAFLGYWEQQRYAGKRADPLILRQALRRLRRALPWWRKRSAEKA